MQHVEEINLSVIHVSKGGKTISPQIAMMTSVYCTIVMSFERYVRIGGPISCVRSCGGYITEKNFK